MTKLIGFMTYKKKHEKRAFQYFEYLRTRKRTNKIP
jgi:hypothetical protein